MNKKELTINEVLHLAAKKHQEGELQKAEILYRKILEKDPNNANALHLLGVIAYQVGKYDEAIKKISAAIELNPNSFLYYNNLAMVYDSSGNEDESAKSFEKALEINPNYNKAAIAHYNLGIFYAAKGEIERALLHYDKAIELDKELYDAHWNRGLLLLLLGKFKEGWCEYEYRFKKKEPTDSRVFRKPKWDGSSLEGKRILILSEQGFGDNIQFVRYLPLIKAKGGHTILECKKELERLFNTLSGVDEFIENSGNYNISCPEFSKGQFSKNRNAINRIVHIEKREDINNISFDFYIHLMSLPSVFKTDLESIPKEIPYLRADAELSSRFKEKFKTNKFKVGIAWVGNPKWENDKKRSMSFEKFKVLTEIPEIELFSLQKGEAAKQIEETGIIDMADEISDFADTAAIIENLDLVISVDTCVAHLAGAMGKPAWTLLAFMPDWRWLLDNETLLRLEHELPTRTPCVSTQSSSHRKDNPWYPSMRLFRQPKAGDWDSVLNKVKQELEKILSK